MKEFWKSGIIMLLIVGALYIIFLRECKKEPICPAPDEIIIKKSVWDSIKTIANKPPIITMDTFKIKGETVYIGDTPISKPVINEKDSTKEYLESITNKEIDVKIHLKIKGQLLDRSWAYTPIFTKIVKETTIFVPKIIDNPVPIPKHGLFGYVTAGGNGNTFLFGGGIDFITKKNTEFGYFYQRYGNVGFHSLKLGIQIKF
jgi:hypothetical protein